MRLVLTHMTAAVPVAVPAAAPAAVAVMQYAQWEESQKDFRRARSVWERALDTEYTNTTFWLKVWHR